MSAPDVPLTQRRPVRLGAVALLLLAGIGTWWLLSDSDGDTETTAGEVVSEFFLAQREGDCERLLEVLSEASWSADGERSRSEFLEQCPEAIAGYVPLVDQVAIDHDYDHPDQAVVESDDLNYRTGDDAASHLVREDDEWKVVTDETTLRIGPSAEEAVRGYLEAYAAGDCEAITTYVTEETWSENGTLGRDEFLRQCEAAAQAREGSAASIATDAIEVTHHGAGDARAAFVLPGRYQRPEHVSLVKDDLRWKVQVDEDLAGVTPGTYLRSLRVAQLQVLLVDQPTLDRRSCHNYLDSPTGADGYADAGMPREPDGVDAEAAVSREYHSCYAAVTLYEFADDATARTAAERLAGELLESDRKVGFPGHPTAIGVRTGCDVDGCLGATAFQAHGRQVVGAYSQLGDLDQAVQLLTAQVKEL
jgi:hypothetical protein